MTAELAVAADHALATVPSVTTTEYLINPTGGRLVAWADAARAAASLGTALASTSFVPRDFRGKPEECAAAILLGDEIGLTPLAALRSIFVIGGTPGMYARTMVAVVQSLGHEVSTVTDTPTKVTVKGRRRGTDEWTTVEWTTERARRAGYTSNRKYETDPQAMLYARAASDVCRRIAADALLGIPHSVEELELSSPATVKVTRSESSTVQRKAVADAAPDAEPSFDDEAAASVEQVQGAEVVEDDAPPPEAQAATGPEADGITTAQTRKLAALMRELAITDRPAALAYCGDVIGRDITSRGELTRREASHVIDALQADRDAADASAALGLEPEVDPG